MKFRTGYEDDADVHSLNNGFECVGESMTKQEFGKEVDINQIAKQVGMGYETMPPVNPPMQGDFTNASDYQESLNVVIAGREAFQKVDPVIRERFNNNPQKYMEFLYDENNRDEAIKLGLVNPAVPEPPIPIHHVRVITPPDDDDDDDKSKRKRK